MIVSRIGDQPALTPPQIGLGGGATVATGVAEPPPIRGTALGGHEHHRQGRPSSTMQPRSTQPGHDQYNPQHNQPQQQPMPAPSGQRQATSSSASPPPRTPTLAHQQHPESSGPAKAPARLADHARHLNLSDSLSHLPAVSPPSPRAAVAVGDAPLPRPAAHTTTTLDTTAPAAPVPPHPRSRPMDSESVVLPSTAPNTTAINLGPSHHPKPGSSPDLPIFIPHHNVKSPPSQTKPRKRTRATPEQLAILEQTFRFNTSPNAMLRARLASELCMNERSIQIWFQNRRAKRKMLDRQLMLQKHQPQQQPSQLQQVPKPKQQHQQSEQRLPQFQQLSKWPGGSGFYTSGCASVAGKSYYEHSYQVQRVPQDGQVPRQSLSRTVLVPPSRASASAPTSQQQRRQYPSIPPLSPTPPPAPHVPTPPLPEPSRLRLSTSFNRTDNPVPLTCATNMLPPPPTPPPTQQGHVPLQASTFRVSTAIPQMRPRSQSYSALDEPFSPVSAESPPAGCSMSCTAESRCVASPTPPLAHPPPPIQGPAPPGLPFAYHVLPQTRDRQLPQNHKTRTVSPGPSPTAAPTSLPASSLTVAGELRALSRLLIDQQSARFEQLLVHLREQRAADRELLRQVFEQDRAGRKQIERMILAFTAEREETVSEFRANPGTASQAVRTAAAVGLRTGDQGVHEIGENGVLREDRGPVSGTREGSAVALGAGTMGKGEGFAETEGRGSPGAGEDRRTETRPAPCVTTNQCQEYSPRPDLPHAAPITTPCLPRAALDKTLSTPAGPNKHSFAPDRPFKRHTLPGDGYGAAPSLQCQRHQRSDVEHKRRRLSATLTTTTPIGSPTSPFSPPPRTARSEVLEVKHEL